MIQYLFLLAKIGIYKFSKEAEHILASHIILYFKPERNSEVVLL